MGVSREQDPYFGVWTMKGNSGQLPFTRTPRPLTLSGLQLPAWPEPTKPRAGQPGRDLIRPEPLEWAKC